MAAGPIQWPSPSLFCTPVSCAGRAVRLAHGFFGSRDKIVCSPRYAEFFLSRYVRPRKIVHQASSVRRQRAVDAGAVDVVIGSLQAPGCCNGVVAAILQNLKGLSPTPERTEKRVTFGKAPATQLPRLGSFPRWSGGWGGWDSARFSSSALSHDSSAAEVTAGLSRSSSSEVCADLP